MRLCSPIPLRSNRAGLSYTRIGWDDIRDRYGKTANYDTASQFELEAGIKFEKTLPLDGEPAKLYLQPGIVQVFGSGDKVAVSGLNTVHTLDDMTLGSVKGGVSYRVNDRINVSATSAGCSAAITKMFRPTSV